MIYYSTGGYRSGPAVELCKRLVESGVRHIELSGGLPDQNQIATLMQLKEECSFIVHNYFPPPVVPFVLNVGSLNEQVAASSMRHVEGAVRLARSLNSKYYSFHAGFLLDPRVSELGKGLSEQTIFPREQAKRAFIERVKTLAVESKKMGVRLLIENNVMSKKNMSRFGRNVLLMVDADETLEIMGELREHAGLLVDLAHLKVSARSLGFDPVDFLERCEPLIEGYHFSDNDGLEDTNGPVLSDAWFRDHIKPGLDYYTIEVYDYHFPHVTDQIGTLKTMIGA
jgi:sugar phosphate isomerase/epimerase